MKMTSKTRMLTLICSVVMVMFSSGNAVCCTAKEPKLVDNLGGCIAGNESLYNGGESQTFNLLLQQGHCYRFEAEGCEYTKHVKISIYRGSKLLVKKSGKPASFLYTPKDDGEYILKVEMQLQPWAGNGKINCCFYETRCNK